MMDHSSIVVTLPASPVSVFLFSNEKLVKHRHLKPVVSHLGAVFTCTLNHF